MSAADSVAAIASTKVTLRTGLGGVGVQPVFTISVTQVTQGLTGAPGNTAPGSGDANFVHNQNSASALWTVNHNLGKYPSVSVVDSAGDECEGAVKHISINQLQIQFSASFSGRAFIN